MNYTILDCYTDEAAGLGVPPYLGTYPRYIYGMIKDKGFTPKYITIDDLRLKVDYNNEIKEVRPSDKTNIRIYNRTKKIDKILSETETLIIVLGVHVPGKYLSALPGTLEEINKLLSGFNFYTILTGPAVFGTQLEGGKYSETRQKDKEGKTTWEKNLEKFNEVGNFGFEFGDFDELQKYALKGVDIVKQIPQYRIIEVGTGRGCNVGKCFFCTEPLKNRFVNRKTEDIIEEMKRYYNLGCRYFRFGKQSDFYSIEDPIKLLKTVRKDMPDIEVLHIDNVNPVFVVNEKGKEITKSIVKYCTSGNVAAFGVESFDSEVVKANMLNCKPNIAMKAIEILNKYGGERGDNGMPKFLPGINIIFGLGKESKKTHEYNMNSLKEIYDKGWMLRRINIRQAAILPNTMLEKKYGNQYLRKNKKYYWKWRDEIRQKIDYPMLKRLVPKGTILKKVYTEIYDGKTTFGRQIGTYPLIVGIKERLPLKKFVDVEITDHMLRSVTGKVVN